MSVRNITWLCQMSIIVGSVLLLLYHHAPYFIPLSRSVAWQRVVYTWVLTCFSRTNVSLLTNLLSSRLNRKTTSGLPARRDITRTETIMAADERTIYLFEKTGASLTYLSRIQHELAPGVQLQTLRLAAERITPICTPNRGFWELHWVSTGTCPSVDIVTN